MTSSWHAPVNQDIITWKNFPHYSYYRFYVKATRHDRLNDSDTELNTVFVVRLNQLLNKQSENWRHEAYVTSWGIRDVTIRDSL